MCVGFASLCIASVSVAVWGGLGCAGLHAWPWPCRCPRAKVLLAQSLNGPNWGSFLSSFLTCTGHPNHRLPRCLDTWVL